MKRILIYSLLLTLLFVACNEKVLDVKNENAYIGSTFFTNATSITVLMDVGLRDASGYECRRKLLAINRQVRVIFMSGQQEIAPREITRKSVFLQKPFTMDQLETAVQDVCL